MFSKGNSKGSREARGGGVPSIISAETKITGDITTEGELQIDGQVQGNIRCQSLIVADTGVVTGEIDAETVSIHGTVTGKVRSVAVTLYRTAHMVGDVSHQSLMIESGAHMEGHCIRADAKADSVVALADARGAASLPPPQKAKEAAEA